MRKAKRILSLVLCLAMVIMTVPALSLTALAYSDSATVSDDTESLPTSGSIAFSNGKNATASAPADGLFGKETSDKIYSVATISGGDELTWLKAHNSSYSSNEMYVAFDVAFTDTASQLRFYTWPYVNASGKTSSSAYYDFKITADGLVDGSAAKGVTITPEIPKFDLNKWYNIVYVSSGAPSYLYINGEQYTVSYNTSYSYGCYRINMRVPTTTGDGTVYMDNIVSEKDATGDYAYNPANHQVTVNLESVDGATKSDTTLSGGTLTVKEGTTLNEIATANSGLTVKAYTDSTYATEVASDAALAEGNLVVVSNGNAFRYYDVAVTAGGSGEEGGDEGGDDPVVTPDETGINIGADVPDTQGDPASLDANVPGTGMKTSDDVVISLGAGTYGNGIKFAKVTTDVTPVIEMSIRAPENGTVGLYAPVYIDSERSEGTKQWYLFKLTNDGFYKCNAATGTIGDKIADAEAGRWYNVAVEYPAFGGKEAKLYIDGACYEGVIGWPRTGATELFYGIQRSVLYCDAEAGTVLVDNLRQTTGKAYDTTFECKATVTKVEGSGLTISEEDGTITFEGTKTVDQLIECLNKPADANVRVYSNGRFTTLLSGTDEVNDGAVVVVAAKNGYSFERTYSYYTVNPVPNPTIFDYEVISEADKTAKITGFFEANIVDESEKVNIEIPSEILGYTIVEIGASAFADTAVESVIIPSTVVTIGSAAFDVSEISTIYGEAGSSAETFASDNEVNFVAAYDGIYVIDGALNGDGIRVLSGTYNEINYGFDTLDFTGTIKNTGENDASLKAVIALFDKNGKMLKRSEKALTVNAGGEISLADDANKVSLGIDSIADGNIVKAFLWYAANNMPVSRGYEVEFDADKQELHLLTIGNSFTNDSVSFLNEVFEANGIGIKRKTLMRGSSTIKDHYNNIKGKTEAYNEKTDSINEFIGADKWDVVTIQAATHGDAEHNDEDLLYQYQSVDGADPVAKPYYDYIKSYIAENAPQAKRVVHMTWAPCPEEAIKMFGGMFAEAESNEAARDAALVTIKEGYEYASSIISTEANMMIPTYHAVEALLAEDGVLYHPSGELNEAGRYTSVEGEISLFRDETCHLTYDHYGSIPYGRVLASLTWFEYLTGIDARTSVYKHESISEDVMDILEAAAHAACTTEGITPLNLWGQN